MGIKFKKVKDGIEIIDPIERHREKLITDGGVIDKSTNQNRIQYPVDTTITIITKSFTLPETGVVNIRAKNGQIIVEVDPDENIHLESGEYTLEMSKSVKLYIYIRGEIDIYSNRNSKKIKLSKKGKVTIGARSYHTQPAGTIKTTPAPNDVMQAISTFKSALKTTEPERSYPTLRGHPPLIKIGSEIDIPEKLKQCDFPIQIKIPPTLNNIFIVTPLAYYLGAKVLPGSEPQLITENGYKFNLAEGNSFESTVAQVMKQIFVFDCIIRTEGNSPGPVYEREVIESELKFDISKVYNKSLSEQVETYLEVPFSIVESQYPQWNPTVTVEPSKENIEFLPFIAENLALVNTVENSNQIQSKSINGLSNSRDLISEPMIHQNWKCNDDLQIESTTPLAAYYNNIGRKPSEDPLEIKVICNDSNMSEELLTAQSAYGDRDELPFNVTFYNNLTKKQLQDILVCNSDFTHYIGHIDKDGFRCTDGNLDATSLEKVKTKVFFLNACHSHNQGLGLVEAGSIGGIVTNDEIQNDNAVNIGSMIARLLNLGYPIYAAVDIARIKSTVGEQYHIVGDGWISIAQSKTTVPNSCSIIQDGEKSKIKVDLYSCRESKKGSIYIPSIDSIKSYRLVQQDVGPYSISKAELIKYLDINPIPVMVDGSVYWSDEFSIKHI